jgi:PadR family transcriptional regulator, regulatory protein AphA
VQQESSRNPAEFPILGFLMNGPAHGYDICSKLSESLGHVRRLGRSHVYAVLVGMEKHGLVGHERVDQETRPARKVFRITHKGREVFMEWVRSPVGNVRDIRLEFLTKLYFAEIHSPEAVDHLVTDQLSVCGKSLERMKDIGQLCKTGTQGYVVDFRLSMINATRSWLLRLRNQTSNRPDAEKPGCV